MVSVTEELERLAALFREGLITREQFEEQRDNLLAQSRSDSSPPSSGTPSPGIPNQVGAYRITGHIGDGGMGTVYRGQHRSSEFAAKQGGEVAIKVMHPHVARNEDFAERFEREAGLGLKLDHPGICKVHELIMDGGVLALVMELLDGEPLSDIIGSKTGPIPWQRAWPMFEQLLESVAYMHSQRVLHRDIKPENVLVTGDGRLKLLDLGIAKDVGSGQTKTGVGMGTVDYMAPEQHTDAGKVDERADVYSLGMTLYEMLAGRLPWGETLDAVMVLQRKLSGQIPPPTDFYPDIPAEVVAALMGALATDRGERTGSAAALAEALGAAVTGAVERPRPGSSRAQQPTVAPLPEFAEDEPTPSYPARTSAPSVSVSQSAEDEPTPAHPTTALPTSAPLSPATSSPSHEAPRSRGGRARLVNSKTIFFGLLLGGVITWAVLGSMGQPPATALDALERDFLQSWYMARDEVTVAGLYQEACDDGYRVACHWLQERDGQRPTLALDGEFFEPYCEDDDPLACLVVGWSLTQKHAGSPSKDGPDPERGASLIDGACQQGYLPACAELGSLHHRGKAGFARDETKAAELYGKVCDAGEMRGCAALAWLYLDGDGDGDGGGVTKDESKAAELYRKACDGGVAFSCNILGILHERGEGVPRDPAEAARLFRKACDGDSTVGCYSLGDVYSTGTGVTKDESKTAQLFGKACDGGYMLACYSLGDVYSDGTGVPKDESKAAELYRKACDGGNKPACTKFEDRWRPR